MWNFSPLNATLKHMANLDEELAKAIRDSEKEAEQVGTSSATVSAEPAQRNVGLLISLVVMGALVLGVVLIGMGGEGKTYSMDVQDMLKSDKKDRDLRIKGQLVTGTLAKRDQPCEYRFKIESGGDQVEIRYPECIVPDTLRDVKGMPTEVTVEGRLNASGYFDARHVVAKCPSKYDMDEMKAQGRMMEQVPVRTVESFPNN